MRRDNRKLEIRTDSQYVYDGVHCWRKWRERGWQGAHKDLWQQLSQELASRRSDGTRLTKVKGHATNEDVDRGRVLLEDKTGNDGADALARAGAVCHEAPHELVETAKLRRYGAEQVQKMMLEILKARRAALQDADDVAEIEEIPFAVEAIPSVDDSEEVVGHATALCIPRDAG